MNDLISTNAKVKIYVVTHKEFVPPSNPIYTPIQVGKSFTGKNLMYISDDTGDNISLKNPNYCELTALYWIWKNDNSDIVGLCHYRRYFSLSKLFKNEHLFLNKTHICKYLQIYDAIVPYKDKIRMSVEQLYTYYDGREKDLNNLHTVIKTYYPEYLNCYESFLKKKAAFYCNMIICKKELLDDYCEWLFDILEKLEPLTNLEGYSKAELRIYGYLSELLLNVWLDKNQLNLKYMPVINTETSIFYRIKKILNLL